MDTNVEVDFVKSEMENNVETAVIVGDEADQKNNVERRSTTMAGSFTFSLWMWYRFVPAFLGLLKMLPMVG